MCSCLLKGDIATCAKEYLYVWNVNGNLLASIRVTSRNQVTINCCIMSEVCVCVRVLHACIRECVQCVFVQRVAYRCI